MDLPTKITVHELYSRKHDWNKAVVLKELPADDTIDIGYLETFLDVVLGEDANLHNICSPIESATAVIAVFDKPVNDVGKYEAKLDKRRYKGKTLCLEKLGRAVGIFLPNIPVNVDDEYITLYFESEKRCGYECEVESVKVKAKVRPNVTDRCAAVTIFDETAVDTILAKQGHVMKDNGIFLEPYFPAYHDYVMEKMEEEETEGLTCETHLEKVHENYGEQKVYVKQLKEKFESPPREFNKQAPKPAYMKPVIHVPIPACKPAWEDTVDNITSAEEPTPVSKLESDVSDSAAALKTEEKETGDIGSTQTGKLIFLERHNPTAVLTKGQEYVSVEKNDSKNDDDEVQRSSLNDDSHILSGNPFTTPRKPAKLMECIIDGLEDMASNSVGSTGKTEPLIKPQHIHFSEQGQMAGVQSKFNPPPSPKHKPESWKRRNIQDPNPNCDKEVGENEVSVVYERNAQRPNEPNRQRKPSGAKSKGKMNESVEVPVMVAKIILLKNSKYELKPSDSVSVFLDEKQSKVVIRGITQADISAEKLRLYEHMNKICELTEQLTVNRSAFFSQKETLGQLRFLCKKENLKIAIYVCAKQHELHCLAFTEEEAKRGLALVKEKLQVKNVKLRPGQLELFHGPKWSDFQEQLKGTLGTVYVSEDNSKVMVEGFTGKSVENTRLKVVEFLKNNVVKVTTKLELNGAEAKCFQKFMQKNLEKTIRQRHGFIKVEIIKADYPMKLNLTVEGDETIVREAKDCLDQIWHEGLDFRKISENDSDLWLMMKGLTGEHGRPFLKKFQQDHSCFINVTEEGQLPPPPRDVKEEMVHKRQDSPPEQQADDSPVVQRRQRGSNLRSGHGLSTYQPSYMTEGDAVQYAVMQSLQFDNSSDDEDARPRQYHRYGENRQPRPAFYLEPEKTDVIRPHRRREAPHIGPMSEFDPSLDGIQDQPADEQPVFNRGGIHRRPGCGYSLPSSVEPRRDRLAAKFGEENGREMKYSITINRTHVVLRRGTIAKFKADCLVNIVGPSMKLDEGTVSKSFRQEGGSQLDTLFQQSKQLAADMAIETRCCGNLQCQSVYHVVLQKGAENCSKSVQQAVSKVLSRCVAQECESVAFPPLGVGRMYQYDPSLVARAMLQGTEKFLSKQRMRVVTFVIYENDDNVFSKFKKVFQYWENKDSNSPIYDRPLPSEAAPQHYQNRLQQVLSMQRAARAFKEPDIARPSPLQPRKPVGSQDSRKDKFIRKSVSEDGIFRGRRHVQQSTDTTQVKKTIDKAPKRDSRFPKDTPVKRLTVVVFAETKDKCIGARNKLSKDIKDEFLFEEKMKKMQQISLDAKEKIVAVITKHKVKSIRGNDGYIVKGRRESVNTAIKEILQILVDSGGGQADRAVHEKRQRRKRAQRETVEYIKFMAEEEPDVPRYWKNFKPGHPLRGVITDVKMLVKGRKHIKVTLESTDRIYNSIVQVIKNTWDASTRGQGQDARGLDQLQYTRMHVTKIERIENLDLYQEYVHNRVKVFTNLLHSRLPRYPEIHRLQGCTGKIKSVEHADKCLLKDMNKEINEFYFFHGTKHENIGVICDQGFDNRLASGSAMFGQGIYGAETPSKADQYADDKTNRTAGHGQPKHMFFMRMILGNVYVCTDQNPHKFKRPPCTTCQRDDCRKHQGLHDSVVGDNKKLFREFVVYDKGLCYPEYLITYERL